MQHAVERATFAPAAAVTIGELTIVVGGDGPPQISRREIGATEPGQTIDLAP